MNPAKNATVPLCYFRNGLKYNLHYKDYKNNLSSDLNPKNQWDKTSRLGFIYIMQFTSSYYVPQEIGECTVLIKAIIINFFYVTLCFPVKFFPILSIVVMDWAASYCFEPNFVWYRKIHTNFYSHFPLLRCHPEQYDLPKSKSRKRRVWSDVFSWLAWNFC